MSVSVQGRATTSPAATASMSALVRAWPGRLSDGESDGDAEADAPGEGLAEGV